MTPGLATTRDPEAFARVAEAYLSERLERNLLATILIGARTGLFPDQPHLFAHLAEDDGTPIAVMMRTHPMPAVVTGLDHPAVTREPGRIDALVAHWLELDPDLPGVLGEPGSARALAAAWAERTGGTSAPGLREAMHALSEVTDPPRPAPGRLRVAEPADGELLLAWELAFMTEAHSGPPEGAPLRLERRIAAGRQFLWEDEGEPVCTVGCNVPVAGTQRVAPVYTPPEHRRRGYASSATAAVSRHLLAHGAERCMLFTDLANPTSNAIYASVGYRRFADFEEHIFIPPA